MGAGEGRDSVDTLEADYVVVGAGALGLAFIDVLLDETDADIVLLDRRPGPGGHWRDAYPFVKLHNVSALYGVNSTSLGSGGLDRDGLDPDCLERASGPEVLAYLEQVFTDRILASGRVRWLPGHDFEATHAQEGRATCLADGMTLTVRARRQVVDATYTATRIPKLDAPGFSVAEGVHFVSPEALAVGEDDAAGYTVIGAGKTAMDVVGHLLARGVDPEAICWVRPRDPWLLNRARLQPADAYVDPAIEGFAAEMEAAAAASSPEDFFRRLEAAGCVLRLDPAVEPTMFRCAIAGEREVAALRAVRNVVRLGRVTALEPGRIVLEKGVVPVDPKRIIVHCAADGAPRRAPVPVFQPGRIVLQFVRRCAPTFSASLIARVAALGLDDGASNALCETVPMVNVAADWAEAHLVEARNRQGWNSVPALRRWVFTSRLDGFGAVFARAAVDPGPARAALFDRLRRAQGPGLARMQSWLG